MGGFQIVDLIPPLPAHHRVRTLLPGRQAQGDHGRAGLLAQPARGGGGGGEGGVPGHGHGEDDGQARTPRPAAVDGALPLHCSQLLSVHPDHPRQLPEPELGAAEVPGPPVRLPRAAGGRDCSTVQ